MAMPVQARINSELGLRMQDGLLAAIVSFAGGGLIMAALALSQSSGRSALRNMAARSWKREIPWQYHTAGLIGAYFVLAQAIFVPAVGVAIYTVAVVTGQTTSGLAADRIGLAGGKRGLTATRLLGVALTIVAVLWAVSPRISRAADPTTLLLPLAFLVLAGILMSFQHAMNGAVAAQIQSPFPGTLANYAVGSLALSIVWLMQLAIEGRLPAFPTDPWLYAGGILGCVNLVISALLITRIGVLLTGLGMIVGQLTGSLLLDWLLPVTGSAIYPETIFGTLLTFIAVACAALPRRRFRS